MGSLSNARLAYQTGIILGPAAQDLHDPLNLLLSSHHRIQFSLFCQGSEVPAVLLQSRRISTLTPVCISGSLVHLPVNLLRDAHAVQNGPVKLLEIHAHRVKKPRSHALPDP